MTASQYSLLSALIFTLVAVLQLVREIRGWPVTLGIACVVAAVFAWFGFTASQA